MATTKPAEKTRTMKVQPENEPVTLKRLSDGKEVTVPKRLVAEHINRGDFEVTKKSDMPSEVELSQAVGYTRNAKLARDIKSPREPQRAETYVENVVKPKKV